MRWFLHCGRIVCALLALAAGEIAAETVAVNGAIRYQTMTGWEVHARAWEQDKANNRFDPSAQAQAAVVAARLVNELGINRLQLPVRSGWMNPVDYWTPFVNQQLSYTAMGSHWYEKVAGAGYQFAEFDYNVETWLVPMKQLLEARGERLYVNLVFVDFNSSNNGNFEFALDAAAYANFVEAYAERLRSKYGVTLDALEVICEPENTDNWRGTQIGNALVALRARFAAGGFGGVNLIAPSVTNAANTLPYLSGIAAVPGALAALDTVAYHRYSPGDYAAIGAYAQGHGLAAAMSEWLDGTIDTLLDDLTLANVSSWQKWAIATRVGQGTQQAYHYLADLGNPAGPAYSYAPNTAHLALVFRYVRLGAVRVDAQSASMRVVAFVNADGGEVVVSKRTAGQGSAAVTYSGLRPGTYGVRAIAAGSTTAVDLPDVVVAADGTVTVTQSAGYATLYAKSSLPPAGPGNATVVANPYGPLAVQGGSVNGASITAFQSNAIISLGNAPGSPGAPLQIDFQGLHLGAGTSLTLISGAPGQIVYLRSVDSTMSSIAGTLKAEGGNGAPPPALYLQNAEGITVAVGGAVVSPSGLTLDTLGSTFTSGRSVDNAGEVNGGRALELVAAAIHGGGAFRGDAVTVRSFGNANNPISGAHYLANALQFFPSTGSTTALTINDYGTSPQILNLMVNGNATVSMPSLWPPGTAMPPNNAPLPAAQVRPAGAPEPGCGGGSLIVQASGNMTLDGGSANDFVFPGGIVLKAGGTLDLNGVTVNQGWTVSGKAFQGIYFESPNIVTPSPVSILSNDLNWTNFSTTPAGHFRISRLAANPDGTASYAPADLVAAHLNTYSLLIESAVNGQCWTCLIDIAAIDVR